MYAAQHAAWLDDSLHTKAFGLEQGMLLQDLVAVYTCQREKDALFEYEFRLKERQKYLADVVEFHIKQFSDVATFCLGKSFGVSQDGDEEDEEEEGGEGGEGEGADMSNGAVKAAERKKRIYNKKIKRMCFEAWCEAMKLYVKEIPIIKKLAAKAIDSEFQKGIISSPRSHVPSPLKDMVIETYGIKEEEDLDPHGVFENTFKKKHKGTGFSNKNLKVKIDMQAKVDAEAAGLVLE